MTHLVREIYDLHEVEGWSVGEIARELDFSEDEVSELLRSEDYERYESLQGDLLEGLTGKLREIRDNRKNETCKRPNQGEHPFSPLVTYDDSRISDKERLIKYILTAPYGVPLISIVKDVFEYDTSDNIDGSNRDYQFARRFYIDNPSYFSVEKQNGMTAVTYRSNFIDLISQGITQDSEIQTDREFCRDLLGSVSSLSEDARDFLANSVRSYIQRVDNYRIFLRRKSGFRDEIVRFPYKTRFNDVDRINKQWAKLQQSLRFGARAYCTPHDGDEYLQETSERCWIGENRGAVLATLTTDPKRHASILDGTDNLTDSINKLMGWLATQPKTLSDGRERWEGRLPYIKVLEFGGSSDSEYYGLPHVHVIFFNVPTNSDGMPYLIDKDALSSYWSENCGQGEIVDLQPLVYQKDLPDSYSADSGLVAYDDSYTGSRQEGVSTNQTAGQYLGKYLSVIYGSILDILDSDQLDGVKYSDKAEAWKVGAYWATEKKIMSMSRGLEEDVLEEDGMGYSLPEFEFLGAYHFNDIPTHLLNDSVPLEDYVQVNYPQNSSSHVERDRPPPTEA